MTMADCSLVTIPPHPTLDSAPQRGNLAASIITLLMAKLAEYIIPSMTHVNGKIAADKVTSPTEEQSIISHFGGHDDLDESGQAAVYIYRRDNESAAEILHLLLNQDPRQLGQRMETVLRLDQSLTDDGKAEIYTDTYRACYRRAVRWANMGFTVSIEPPAGSGGGGAGARPSGTEADRKKAKAEAACKKKNAELLKTDPPRPFLSGTVAYSLASEIVGLLTGLLSDPDAAQVWKNAIKDVLQNSLATVPSCVPLLETYCKDIHTCIDQMDPPPPADDHLSTACLANATFTALGGFKDSVRPNMKAKVLGEGLVPECEGTVISISERRGVANVQFEDDKYCFGANHTLEVPLSRLLPPEVNSLPLEQLGLEEHLCRALVATLSTAPPAIEAPHTGMDASQPALGLCRLFAELRSRAAMVMAYHATNDKFKKCFLKECDVQMLLKQSEVCLPGERLVPIEAHCLSLRMLYRDCARPPAPIIERPRIERKRYYLDISRKWPPIPSCCFSHHFTTLIFQGTTTSTGPASSEEEGLEKPKGAFVVTNTPIPVQAPSFYYEVELTQLDAGSTAPHLTLGMTPEPKKPEQGENWTYPEETCLLRSTGRGCQVRGEDRLQWSKLNLEGPLKTGDTVGCGWVRGEQGGTGTLYYTINGTKLEHMFHGVPSSLYPFVHVQKKGLRIKVNFGDRPFAYPEGHAHRDAADVREGESTEEVAAMFKVMAFAGSDSEEEGPPPPDKKEEDKKKEKITPQPLVAGPTCRDLTVPTTLPEGYDYDGKTSLLFPLTPSFNTMLESGPLIRPGGRGNQEEEEEEEESGGGAPQEEDLHLLLVKAWEAKVFPVIQRRFRNDQERKSGLEQIRGALQLGMESIAQETVEFLYDENGGLPRDLHFPTLDDVKADLEKFTIGRVRKGSAVVVQKDLPYSRCGVRAMQKTQGLTGIVLGVDHHNELVQVECYIPSDGALVRFWYPVVYLERPPKGYRKPSALRGADSVNILVHRELLSCESKLMSIYSRSALLSLTTPTHSIPFTTSLTLTAQDSFSQPSVEGLCSTTCPSLSPSLETCLMTILGSPHTIFFSGSVTLENIVKRWLEQNLEGFPDVVKQLVEPLVGGVPKGCGHIELAIPETKESVDVFDSDAVFMIVSPAEEKLKSSSSASYKYPWAKVFSYRGGQGKNGRMPLLEIGRYPNEIPQAITQQYCGPVLPSMIVPTNRLHLKMGGCSPLPGQLLHVVGVSQALPILATFTNSLSLQVLKSQDNISQCQVYCDALSSCILPLIKYLCLEAPPIYKERLFKLLSSIFWTLSSSTLIQFTSYPVIPSEFVQSLTQELEKVYETECESFLGEDKSKGKGQFPPTNSIGRGGSGKFSTYFQALLELVLSVENYMCVCHKKEPATPTTSKKSGKKAKKSASTWITYIRRATAILLSLYHDRPLPKDFYYCFNKSLPAKCPSRLVVVTGIDTCLEAAKAQEIIGRLCNQYGGLYRGEMYVPTRDQTAEELLQETLDREKEKADLAKAEKEKKREEKREEKKEEQAAPSGSAAPIEEKKKEKKETEEKKEEGEIELDSTPQPLPDPKKVVKRGVVLELCSKEKTSAVSSALLSCGVLQGKGKALSVSCVSDSLKCGEDEVAREIVQEYLTSRVTTDDGKLADQAREVLTKIFQSGASENGKVSRKALEDEAKETLLRRYLSGMGGVMSDTLSGLFGEDEEVGLERWGEWLQKECDKDACVIWSGLFAAGYDLHFERCGFLSSEVPTPAMDKAVGVSLVHYIDSLCRRIDVSSASLLPCDVSLSEADLASQHLTLLQGQSIADIRWHMLRLKHINRQLSWLLPLIDLCSTYPLSLGVLLASIAPLLFYDVKMSIFHSVLNAATRRSLDQAPPELKMDPLETVGGLASTALETQFCQAARQMLSVPSPQLCVPLASGGDPTYAFNVKLAGEEVHGTSGSFRHFLWQVVRELQSPLLPILTLCPSSAAGINKGKYILCPGHMSYSEEKLLEFFGQLLGVAIRADVPVAIDLLPCFWKGLKGETLTIDDLKEADCLTYTMTQKITEAEDEASFDEIVSGISQTMTTSDESTDDRTLRFTYLSMRGVEEELCEGGRERVVCFSNRQSYADAILSYRLGELSCGSRMSAVRCGLASVIPLQLLSILTPQDLALRVCGLPDIDLQYLKRHTTYHVGLMETDKHVQFFWNALESFSQEELRKFIKFACNQERIPFGHPCRGEETVSHVPPYPMKIAPPDAQGSPDSRYIRAETCMFLIKLPQYSTQDIMNERLRYAINCREDPLSG